MNSGLSRLNKMSNYRDLVDNTKGDKGLFSFDKYIARNLVTTEESLPIDKLHEFRNHPFKVVDDEAMESLVNSIKNRGILHPVVVRKSGDGYEIISGHRRTHAAKRAGLSKVPSYVVDVSDEEAVILMADANFYQREGLYPSEKAKAYRMKSDAIKRHPGLKGRYSIDEIGEGTNDSSSQIKRYIRLSYLIDELLNLVDLKKLGIEQGFQLSFLDVEKQRIVLEVINENDLCISMKQAKSVREIKEFTKEEITSFLVSKCPHKRKYVIKEEVLNKYFKPETTTKEIDDIVEKALSMYFNRKRG